MNEALNEAELSCSLSDQEYKERRQFARRSLLPHILQTMPTTSGVKLIFNGTSELKDSIKLFISLEQQCCSFLSFNVDQEGKQICLSIDGPEGARDMIDRFVALRR